jgi:polar amino acid transport system permease protein
VTAKADDPRDPGAEGAPSSVISWSAADFPWWLVAMLGIIGLLAIAILTNQEFRNAFEAIFTIPVSWRKGIALTLLLTISAFIISMVIGLFIALLRLSTYNGRRWYYVALFAGVAALGTALTLISSIATTTKVIFLVLFWGVAIIASWRQDVAVIIIRNSATLYIEFVRGIPMLVWIFFIALVLVPSFTSLLELNNRAITEAMRGTVALALFYSAFIAEVFRAGIQSVQVGQIEAGRSIGLSEAQIMRHITLPQAIRNMLPALGNDLISLMKDTSLVSILAVNELTQMARLYAGASFRFRESYVVLIVLYVTLTLLLSLMLRWYERRIAIPAG